MDIAYDRMRGTLVQFFAQPFDCSGNSVLPGVGFCRPDPLQEFLSGKQFARIAHQKIEQGVFFRYELDWCGPGSACRACIGIQAERPYLQLFIDQDLGAA